MKKLFLFLLPLVAIGQTCSNSVVSGSIICKAYSTASGNPTATVTLTPSTSPNNFQVGDTLHVGSFALRTGAPTSSFSSGSGNITATQMSIPYNAPPSITTNITTSTSSQVVQLNASTSTTTLPVQLGSTGSITTGTTYPVGMVLQIVNAANSADYMYGISTASTPLVVDVTEVSTATGTVTTLGPVVTWQSGHMFDTNWTTGTITINNISYAIATINSSTSITLTTSPPTQPSGVAYSILETGAIFSSWNISSGFCNLFHGDRYGETLTNLSVFAPGTIILGCNDPTHITASALPIASGPSSVTWAFQFPTVTGIAAVTVGNSGGTGGTYPLGAILNVTQAGSNSMSQVEVTSVSGGLVTGVRLTSQTPANFLTAANYSVANNVPTTCVLPIGCTGTGATIDITDIGWILTVTDSGLGPGYEKMLVTGDSGTAYTVRRGYSGTVAIPHLFSGFCSTCTNPYGAYNPGPSPIHILDFHDTAGNIFTCVSTQTEYTDTNTVPLNYCYATFTSTTAGIANGNGYDYITMTNNYLSIGGLNSLAVAWYRGDGAVSGISNPIPTDGYGSNPLAGGTAFNTSMTSNSVVPSVPNTGWPVSPGDHCMVLAAGEVAYTPVNGSGAIYPTGLTNATVTITSGNTITGTGFGGMGSALIYGWWPPGTPITIAGASGNPYHVSSINSLGTVITTIESTLPNGMQTMTVADQGAQPNPSSGWVFRVPDATGQRFGFVDNIATGSTCNGGLYQQAGVDGMFTIGIAFHPAGGPTTVYGQSALLSASTYLTSASIPAVNTTTGTRSIDFEFDNVNSVGNDTFIASADLGVTFQINHAGGHTNITTTVLPFNSWAGTGTCGGNGYSVAVDNVASVGSNYPVYVHYSADFTKTPRRDSFEAWDGTGTRIYASFCDWNGLSGSISTGPVTLGGGMAGSDTVKLGFIWERSTILPMNSKMPTFGHANTNCIYDWHLDTSTGGTADSCTTGFYNLTAIGSITYPNTASAVQSLVKAIPTQYGSVSTSISGWATMNSAVGTQQMDCLAQSVTQFNASDSLSCAWTQTQGPTVIFNNANSTSPIISGIVATNISTASDYILSVIVSDTQSTPGTATGTIEMGAVPQDANGVVTNITGNVRNFFGPLMSYGNIPWGEIDNNQFFGIGAQQAFQNNQPYRQWGTPGSGTISYPFTGVGQGFGIPGTYLTGSGITSATATSFTINDASVLSLSGLPGTPTWIMVGDFHYGPFELIRICNTSATTGPATLTVCYDGRGLSGNSSADFNPSAATSWPVNTVVGEMVVKGTGTHFQSDSSRPLSQGGVPGPIGLIGSTSGTVSIPAGSSILTGSGTTWTSGNVGQNVFISATHSSTGFNFWRQITGVTSSQTEGVATGQGGSSNPFSVASWNQFRTAKFQAAVNKVAAGTGNAHVLMIGDSTTAGFPGQAYQSWPALMQITSTLPNSPGLAVYPASTYTGGITDNRWTLNSWTVNTFANVGLGQVSTLTTSGTTPLVFTPGATEGAFDSFRVWYYTNTGLGTFSAAATGGASSGAINTSTTAGIGSVVVMAGSAGTGNAVTITPSSGAIYIMAVEPFLSTKKQIYIGNAGIGGVTSSLYAQNSGALSSTASIQALAPDLCVINLGINDAANGYSSANVVSWITTIATACQASGDVAIMLFWPSQNTPLTTNEALYYPALLSYAAGAGIPIIDIYGQYGGVYQSALSYDAVHPSIAGGYPAIAAAVSPILTNLALGISGAPVVGQFVSGTGIPANAVITAATNSGGGAWSISTSPAPTGSVTGLLTLSGSTATLDHAAPAGMDSYSGSYKFLVATYPSLEFGAAQDNHTVRILQTVYGCESEIACFGRGQHDIPGIDTVTQTGYKYSYQTQLGMGGSFNPNFYGHDTAALNFFLRSGYTPALTLARYISNYWISGPELAEGYAQGATLNIGGGVHGAMASFLVDSATPLSSATFEQYGISYTFQYLLNASNMTPQPCNTADTRDTGIMGSFVAHNANLDSNSGIGTLSGSVGTNSTGGTITGWTGTQTPPFVALLEDGTTYEFVRVTGTGTPFTWTSNFYVTGGGTYVHASGSQLLTGAAMYTFILSKLDIRDQTCRRNSSADTPSGPYNAGGTAPQERWSWANSGYFPPTAQLVPNVAYGPMTMTTGSTAVTSTGSALPFSSMCNGKETGTLSIATNGTVATLLGSSVVGSTSNPRYGGTAAPWERIYIWDQVSYLGAFAYIADNYGATGAHVTLAGTWLGANCTSGSPCTYMTADAGSFLAIWYENNDTYTDNEALKKTWECVYNSPTSITLNRPWDGPSTVAGSPLFWGDLYTVMGFPQQPFMLGGYKTTGMRWAQHSTNSTVAFDYTTMAQQAGTWERTWGWDYTNSNGLYYGAVQDICPPTTVLPFNYALVTNTLYISTIHGGDSGNPGCGAVGSNIANSIARVNNAEGGQGMAQWAAINPSTNNSYVDTFIGRTYGAQQPYGSNSGCSISVASTCDGIDALNCEMSNMGDYKWFAFCFGEGGFFATSYPAQRTLSAPTFNPVPIIGAHSIMGRGLFLVDPTPRRDHAWMGW